MERYRRALAQYMAEQQPMKMATGGLTQSDYNTFVDDVYANVVAYYGDNIDGANQYIADRIRESIAGFADAGIDPDMGMLKNAIESIGGGTYGQDRAQLDNVLYFADQTLEPLGYDLGTYTPITPEPEPEPPVSGPTIGGGGDNIDIGGGDSPVTIGDGSDVTVDVPAPEPEPLVLTQNDYDTYTQSVFDRAVAGQITPEQIIEEISSGFNALQDQGYNVEADKLISSVNTVWSNSSTGEDVPTEINNALFALDQILEPQGLDIGTYSLIEPPPPEEPLPPPGETEVPIDTTSTDSLANTVLALTQQAQTTGDYTTLNQFLQDQGIQLVGLKALFPQYTDEEFQAVLDAGVTPFGYTQPVVEEPVVPTVEDIPSDFYKDFQTYYNTIDSEERGTLAQELENYITENLDVGSILASANAKDYEFGGEYAGAFAPEVYDPGLPFYSYRTPQSTGINVRNPFGSYTLSKAESDKSAIAPQDVATFEQEAFGRLSPVERDALINSVVSEFGLTSDEIPARMIQFGVTPEQISSATTLPLTGLPTGIQSVTSDQFATRTIPGTVAPTFVPQIRDITPLSGVSGLPSLTAPTLPTYNPISFAATPLEVAQATIDAMNAPAES